jgi:hypothetical protein
MISLTDMALATGVCTTISIPLGYHYHNKIVRLQILDKLMDLAGEVSIKSFLFLFLTTILGSLGITIPIIGGFFGIYIGVVIALQKESNKAALRDLDDEY